MVIVVMMANTKFPYLLGVAQAFASQASRRKVTFRRVQKVLSHSKIGGKCNILQLRVDQLQLPCGTHQYFIFWPGV